MKKYIPSGIESKWQEKWKDEGLYLTNLENASKKYYVLVELAYTSGDLHMGHWFTFVMGDILARFKKAQGFNVLFPNGFDAFGLPAENAAIKNGIHPRDWTYQNMERMRAQFETLGTSIDWTKTMVACDPKYYKWNQWIFLKMLEKGLAYKGEVLSNWCPGCNTVLANENVENGKCWRCGTEVIQKEVEQWFFKITDYAEKLLWPTDQVEDPERSRRADWPKSLIAGQNEWIGKSEGVTLKFPLVTLSDSEGSLANASSNKSRDSSASPQNDIFIEVFTTRPDTTDGATFLVLAPEHHKVLELTTEENRKSVQDYLQKVGGKSELQRKENKEKTGVFTGSFVKNPISSKKIPVWVSDYVLMGYGTGAIMAVPFADERDKEFAEKFDLPIEKTDFKSTPKGEKKINYHLHDWSISRQRYWGTPIPIIYCDKCGTVPVPEKDLPVELPYKVDYAPQGKPPLATAEDWVNVECPKCGGKAKREVETMDTFVDSAWYFFRYLDPENDMQPFDKLRVEQWMPLDIYIGGPEHTLGHALYSRFFTMVFKELGLVKFEEYAKKRIHHGTILGPDGSRMSKSKGNVINPDVEVKKYGADAIRLYLMFLGPFDIVTPWNPDGVNGVFHFLQRIWGLQEKLTVGHPVLDTGSIKIDSGSKPGMTAEDLKIMHKTIKKVTEDLEQLKFNTAIASMMEWLNHLSRKEKIAVEEYETLLLLLSPFAPHLTEELYHAVILRAKPEGSLAHASTAETSSEILRSAQNDNVGSIHQHSWPKFDNKYLEEEQIPIAVQVNGKVRDVLLIQKDMISNKEIVEKLALESEKIKNIIRGSTVKRVVIIPGKIINFVL